MFFVLTHWYRIGTRNWPICKVQVSEFVLSGNTALKSLCIIRKCPTVVPPSGNIKKNAQQKKKAAASQINTWIF